MEVEKEGRINRGENRREGVRRNSVGHLGRVPRDTGVAWRHQRSIMTRSEGEGESPEENGGEKERENWRAFLILFRPSMPTTTVSSPPFFLLPRHLSRPRLPPNLSHLPSDTHPSWLYPREIRVSPLPVCSRDEVPQQFSTATFALCTKFPRLFICTRIVPFEILILRYIENLYNPNFHDTFFDCKLATDNEFSLSFRNFLELVAILYQYAFYIYIHIFFVFNMKHLQSAETKVSFF